MSRWIAFIAIGSLVACAHQQGEVKPPPPSEKKRPVPIEIPRREGQSVVVMPLELERAPLLAPERDRLERWIARHLATQSEVMLDVIPPEEVARVRERAQANELSEGSAVCAARPPLRVAVGRAFPNAWLARPRAVCDGEGCRLLVRVERPDGAPLAWEAPVKDPAQFEAWEESAQLLAVSGAAQAESPAPKSATEEAPPLRSHPVEIVSVNAFGGWKEQPSNALLEALSPRLSRCHERGRIPEGVDDVVLAVNEGGRVAQCDAQSWRDPPDDSQLQCYCEAAEKLTFDPGAAERRLTLELRDSVELGAWTPEGGRVTSTVRNFHSTDAALGEDVLTGVRPWLALCYATTRLRADVTISAKLRVAPTGDIQDAQITGTEQNSVLASCVEGYLRYLPLPCTAAGEPATLQFEVLLQRVDSASPVSRAFD